MALAWLQNIGWAAGGFVGQIFNTLRLRNKHCTAAGVETEHITNADISIRHATRAMITIERIAPLE